MEIKQGSIPLSAFRKVSFQEKWEKGFMYLGILSTIILVRSRKVADLLGITLGDVLDEFEPMELMSLIASSPELGKPAEELLEFIYDN